MASVRNHVLAAIAEAIPWRKLRSSSVHGALWYVLIGGAAMGLEASGHVTCTRHSAHAALIGLPALQSLPRIASWIRNQQPAWGPTNEPTGCIENLRATKLICCR